ncbi:Serine/threonine-protein kinase StkP [Caulifigura coniformis]|uniref:Serine/threonine-protein kinase StkP n=1 Tax=Caulifigura coniformis TaxID=2527983 RepID=A0A517S9U2_9PLAN|nr:protein kinase [Caulifigura coniformis]QDT52882.1 Serine/threonine-protein kinase StkP [Caulifigura coniformis]
MSASLQQFARGLEDGGIVSAEAIRSSLSSLDGTPDSEGLVKELLRTRKLTKFQADEILHGRAQSLVLGNYLLLERIGQGGMGQVFKARHRRMDRIVAVKRLPDDVSGDQLAIARFDREVRAAARISHPNIVAAFDADDANGVHFLVMEYVQGADLARVIRKVGPLPVENAVDLVRQAARGLAAAHAAGIVHRDIKPSNLLLDRHGVLKILDMGLARFESISDDSAPSDLTGIGAIMGTVDYMAPEQALDSKSADARADIYSLGCSLFTLLTGRPVYEGETPTARLMAHQASPIPDLRTHRPEVPESLQAVFVTMVQKDLNDRFQSMTDVIQSLEGFEPPLSPLAVDPFTDLSPRNSAAYELAGDTVLERPRSSGFPIRAALAGIAIAGALIAALAFRGSPDVTPAGPPRVAPASPDEEEAPVAHVAIDPVVATSIPPLIDAVRQPPTGFISLFNGSDLQGWQGAVSEQELLAVPETNRPALQQKANEAAATRWTVIDGLLKSDGQAIGLQTIAHYRDCEFSIDWKLPADAAAAITLRGSSTLTMAETGLQLGDRPLTAAPRLTAGQTPTGWNTLHITLRGDKVTVRSNGMLLVDNLPLKNSNDPEKIVPASGPLELRPLKGKAEFRNIFLKVL